MNKGVRICLQAIFMQHRPSLGETEAGDLIMTECIREGMLAAAPIICIPVYAGLTEMQ
jgi:hypothetical protein